MAYVVNTVCLFVCSTDFCYINVCVLFGESGFIFVCCVVCVHAPRTASAVGSFSNIATPITSIVSRPCSRPKTVMRPAEESNQSHPSAAGCGMRCVAAHLPSPGALSYSSPGAGGRAIKFAQLSADTLPAEEKRQGKVSIEPERRPTGRAGVADYTMTTLYYSTPGE